MPSSHQVVLKEGGNDVGTILWFTIVWVILLVQSKELRVGADNEASSLGTKRNHADGLSSVVCQPIICT